MKGLRWNRLRSTLLCFLIVVAFLPAGTKADSAVALTNEPACSRLLPEGASLLPETERIDNADTPLAGPVWALLNLILALAIAIVSLLMFVRKKDSKRARSEGGAIREGVRHGVVRLLTLIPGLGGLLLFILTENMRQPMLFTDRWTLPMGIVAAIQIILVLLSIRGDQKQSDTSLEQTPDEPEVF